jgi:hypothetical protein
MIDLIDYASSPLNPALKIIVFLLFAGAVLLYLDARGQFGGRVRSFVDLLCLIVLFMAIGALLRYFGDGTAFGFTAEYSLKWLQSTCYLFAGISSVLAAHRLLTIFATARP